jgi:leader peptidase (prepilin peptidase)/N-methyltransferase
MLMLFVVLYGLLLGSFYNVVGLRVPIGQSIVKPRSACPYCHHTLTAKELIPVFSYLIQKGKCSQCKGGISPLYAIIEGANAGLFAFAYWMIGWRWELLLALTIISLLMIVFVSDIKYMLIPDKVLLFFTGLFFIERLIFPLHPWWDSFAGAAVGFSLLLFIAVISKGGMGGGDIKLFALIGFAVGVKVFFLSFFLSTFIGTIVGVIGMLFGFIKKGKPFPFGPFIVVGTLVAYFFHEYIINWYVSVFV